MTAYVFDIETNGLLLELDRVHCLVIKDLVTGKVEAFSDHLSRPIAEGLDKLLRADKIIGHNIIGFDIPALAKVYGVTFDPAKVEDTIVLAKLYRGDIQEYDFRNKGKYPKELFGQQSLEAWGYRLRDYKGAFKGPWDQWTTEMQEYCERDVEVTFTLYQYLRRLPTWPKAEKLEHEAAWVCSRIEQNGIPFDRDAAIKLYAQLSEARDKLTTELKDLFPSWVVYQGEVVSKVNSTKFGYEKGIPYSKVKIVEFNPQSRDHIADRLKAKYGWQPTEFTDKGKPQIDEKILTGLDYPEAKALAELFLVMKRLGQLADGTEAWFKRERDGWIYHRLNSNGAITGRATHSRPNISQVPKVGSRYGTECRALFGLIPEPLRNAGLWEQWKDGVLYGVDVAGLELRCLAHYMHRYDDGAYGQAVINGKEADGTDVHSLNTQAIGLEPQKQYVISGKTQKGRDCGKTFIYAFLYGAGSEKIGTTVGIDDSEVGPLIAENADFAVRIRKRLRRAGREVTDKLVATIIKGERIKERFLDRIPALRSLREAVERAAVQRGYLLALDGRQMRIRSAHSALNTLLQGAGALICKAWIVEVDRLCQAAGLTHGWRGGDYAFLIWAHDELQIACRTQEVADTIDRLAKEAIKNVENYFGIRVPLDCSGKCGKTWADTH